MICAIPLAALCVLAADRRKCAGFVIQSHRGAGNLAPDNSMPAFEMGWRMGTIPEADPRTTRDGVLVAFHDNDLKRLAPDADPAIRDKSVNDLDWEVVSKLDTGSYFDPKYAGIHIPRISDILDRMRGRPERRLYLDVKKLPLNELAALVREAGVERQVIMASTKYDEIRDWKRLLPDSGTLHWLGDPEPRLEERLAELRSAGFEDITQLQIHVRVGCFDALGTTDDPFAPSSKFLRETMTEVRAKGILFQVLVIGSKDPRAYEKLMDLGIDSFATDDPLVTLDVMRRRLTKRSPER